MAHNFYHVANVVRVIEQRESSDCGVAVLAMLAGISYEDALRVACGVDEEGASDGLFISQLIAAAADLEITLKRRRRFDITKDSGILYLVHKKNDFDRHVVLLKRGIIIDTNTTVWFDPAKFLRFHKYNASLLLEEVEDVE